MRKPNLGLKEVRYALEADFEPEEIRSNFNIDSDADKFLTYYEDVALILKDSNTWDDLQELCDTEEALENLEEYIQTESTEALGFGDIEVMSQTKNEVEFKNEAADSYLEPEISASYDQAFSCYMADPGRKNEADENSSIRRISNSFSESQANIDVFSLGLSRSLRGVDK